MCDTYGFILLFFTISIFLYFMIKYSSLYFRPQVEKKISKCNGMAFHMQKIHSLLFQNQLSVNISDRSNSHRNCDKFHFYFLYLPLLENAILYLGQLDTNRSLDNILYNVVCTCLKFCDNSSTLRCPTKQKHRKMSFSYRTK